MKKYTAAFQKFAATPPALLLLLFILLVRPLIQVRLFCVSFRIGHIVHEAGTHFLREGDRRSRGKSKRLITLCYWENPSVSNGVIGSHLSEMTGWRWPPRAVMVLAVGISKKMGVARHFVQEMSAGAEVDLFWQHAWHVSFDLSRHEAFLAAEGLANLGIDNTRPLVAFLTRNSEYLIRSICNPGLSHTYRDCVIENYQKAIETCIAQGFQCVRVGRYNNDRIEKYIPHYVDYSHSAVRSDVMDLALAVRTDILVTCSSGLDSLYHLLGKPLVGVNVANLDGRFSNYVTCLPKRMFVMEGSRRRELPVIAAVSKDFMIDVPGRYTFMGTEVIFEENSPEEITEAVSFAIRLVQEDRYREECEAQAAPLWQEFNAMLPLSNLPIAHKQRFPSFGLPPSVIGRFLTA